MLRRKEYKGISKWQLDAPYFVIAEEILEQNIQAIQAHETFCGKQLWPQPGLKNALILLICRWKLEARDFFGPGLGS
jgi:hypothetical protein